MSISTHLLLGACLSILWIGAPKPLLAHGGKYAGPTTPPPAPPAPQPGTYGGPSDTGGGSLGGPRTGNPAGPSGPSQGGGAIPAPGSGTRGGGVATGFYDVSQDLSRWETWWDLNQHSLLGLRSSLFVEGPSTGASSDASLSVDRLRPSDAELREKVVPKLLFVLRHERNPDLLTGAIVALAKIGLDTSLSSEFAHLLADPNQEIAETATLGLGLLRDLRALPALMALASDDAEGRSFAAKPSVPTRTRSFAIYALGLFGAETPDLRARERIVEALRAVSSGNVEIQIARALSLGIVKDPERRGAEDLRRLLDDRRADARVRAMAPISLARLLVDPLVASETGSAPNAHPLLSLAREKALRVAEDNQEPEWLRISCVQALPYFAASGDPAFAAAARKTLLRLFEKGKTGGEKQFAAIALGRMGGAEAEEALSKALVAKSSTLRPWAALALGLAGRANPAAASAIAKRLQAVFEGEKNPSTAGALALGLGLLGDRQEDPSTASLLLARMETSSNEELRGHIALALGMAGARGASSQITKLAHESVRRPELQKQAVVALGLLGDEAVGLDLVRQLGEARTLGAQTSLASAIGWVGDRRTLESLLSLLDRPKIAPLGRAFVAAAIGMIGDPAPTHWSARISSDLNYLAAPPSLLDPAGSAGLLDIL